jgi:hypothetical protein
VALFGLPGGAEWMVILTVVGLLFVPGAGLVGIGYLLGRRSSANREATGATGDAPSKKTDTKDPDTDDA